VNKDASFKGIWCFAEVRHGKLAPTAFELLHAARKMAETSKEEVAAVLMGKGVGGYAQELIERGADKVFVFDDAKLENFVDDAFTLLLAAQAKKEKPNRLLLPASVLGRSIAGRLAVALETGLAADVTGLALNAAGDMEATRPAFGGNVYTAVVCAKRRPEMATVRPMVFPRAEKQAGRAGQSVNVPVDAALLASKTRFVRYDADQNGAVDIGAAEIIVSAGRGVGGAEGFKPVEELAKTLGAAVGASRAAVDAGWIPYRHQVGLTGRTVRPKLYMAFGISGQIQHLAGMSSSDVIVAVNKDTDAPLMKLANLSIQADLFEFIPALIKEIQKRRGN